MNKKDPIEDLFNPSVGEMHHRGSLMNNIGEKSHMPARSVSHPVSPQHWGFGGYPIYLFNY